MKLLLFVGVLAAGYCYTLLHTTDAVVSQVMDLHQTYQSVGAQADQIAGTKSSH